MTPKQSSWRRIRQLENQKRDYIRLEVSKDQSEYLKLAAAEENFIKEISDLSDQLEEIQDKMAAKQKELAVENREALEEFDRLITKEKETYAAL